MAFVTDFVQQMIDAFAAFAPPGIEPTFFWGTFFLIFAIIFVAISKVKLFGSDNKAINVIIALVIAYFAASTTFTTVVLSKVFPNFSIGAVAILVFLIIIALVSGEDASLGQKWYVYVFVGVVVLWIFVSAIFQISGAGVGVPNLFDNWTTTDWAIVVLAIVVIGYFMKSNTNIFGG
jgi:hypothetical protein